MSDRLIDPVTTDTPTAAGPASASRDGWRRLIRSVPGVIGLVIMVVLVITALAALLKLLPYDPIVQDAPARLRPPSPEHLFGTDQFGRDVFSRVASGLANSLTIAVLAVAAATIVGTASGMLAGYFRKTTDLITGGVANVLFAFPPLLLALTLASVLDRNALTVALAIAIVYVPIFHRVARGPVLALREADFVKAAVASGQRPLATVGLHILPNISALIIVQVALSLSWAVLTEAALSFLSLGIPPPAASLGSMIFEARIVVIIAPWTMAAPGIVVVALVAGLNLLGDGLRDAFDLDGGTA